MAANLSTKIFIFSLAEKEKTTKKEYLLALARDIYCMKKKIDENGNNNWTMSVTDQKEAERISEIYLQSLKEKYVA